MDLLAHAGPVAWACADNALQIHGGNGHATEYQINRCHEESLVLKAEAAVPVRHGERARFGNPAAATYLFAADGAASSGIPFIDSRHVSIHPASQGRQYGNRGLDMSLDPISVIKVRDHIAK